MIKTFYRIQYTRKAARNLRALPTDVSHRFVQAFKDIACGEGHWDIKKMKGQQALRLRIGRYRALFLKDNAALVIVIIQVAGRGDIYS